MQINILGQKFYYFLSSLVDMTIDIDGLSWSILASVYIFEAAFLSNQTVVNSAGMTVVVKNLALESQ